LCNRILNVTINKISKMSVEMVVFISADYDELVQDHIYQVVLFLQLDN